MYRRWRRTVTTPLCTSAPASAGGDRVPVEQHVHRQRAFAGRAQHEVDVLGVELDVDAGVGDGFGRLAGDVPACRCRRSSLSCSSPVGGRAVVVQAGLGRVRPSPRLGRCPGRSPGWPLRRARSRRSGGSCRRPGSRLRRAARGSRFRSCRSRPRRRPCSEPARSRRSGSRPASPRCRRRSRCPCCCPGRPGSAGRTGRSRWTRWRPRARRRTRASRRRRS